MTKKQQLEYLITAYMRNEYRVSTFCDEFSRIFFHEPWDGAAADEREIEIFEHLAVQCERYSPFKQDLAVSEYYVDDTYIHNEIIQAYRKLNSISDCGKDKETTR
ncbi:MAG: hypothetical protein ACI4DP_03480 [Candidatus Ornithomonoglobus sp.]